MSHKLIFLLVLLHVCAVCSTGCWDWFIGCFKDPSDDRSEYMRNYERCKSRCKTQHSKDPKDKKKKNFNDCLEKCMKRWNNRGLEYNRRRKQERLYQTKANVINNVVYVFNPSN